MPVDASHYPTAAVKNTVSPVTSWLVAARYSRHGTAAASMSRTLLTTMSDCRFRDSRGERLPWTGVVLSSGGSPRLDDVPNDAVSGC